MIVKKMVTIAGSDSLAGGGIQADLATFDEYNFQGLSAITSIVTVLGDQFNIHAIDLNILAEQLDSIFALNNIAGVKTGLLPTEAHMELVGNFLKQQVGKMPIVIDPVMVFKETDVTNAKRLVEALKTNLLPLATVVTPNLIEAEQLSGMSINSVADLKKAGQKILTYGPQAVLVKGGARLAGGKINDVLVTAADESVIFEQNKLTMPTNNGAGCTLSAAITGGLGKAESVTQAITDAQNFVHLAIEHGVYLNDSFNLGNVWQGAQRAVKKGMFDEN